MLTRRTSTLLAAPALARPLLARSLLAWLALALSACASKPAPPQAAAPSPVAEPQAVAAPAKPRPRHTDLGCRTVRVDLPAERKAALFRQFESEQASVNPTLPTPKPEPCGRAAR